MPIETVNQNLLIQQEQATINYPQMVNINPLSPSTNVTEENNNLFTVNSPIILTPRSNDNYSFLEEEEEFQDNNVLLQENNGVMINPQNNANSLGLFL